MSILNKRCCHFRVLVSGFMYVSILSKSEQMNFSVSLVLQCTKSTNTYIHLCIYIYIYKQPTRLQSNLMWNWKGPQSWSLSDCKWHWVPHVVVSKKFPPKLLPSSSKSARVRKYHLFAGTLCGTTGTYGKLWKGLGGRILWIIRRMKYQVLRFKVEWNALYNL